MAGRLGVFTGLVMDDLEPGPMLLFIRRAGATVLPAVFLSGRDGLGQRYVLERELPWDPCLDIVGNRLQWQRVGDGVAEQGALCGMSDPRVRRRSTRTEKMGA
jgi:hypothetical protein